MPRRRFLPLLALTVLSVDAHSLGIGEIVSQPRLGERLRIEVRLLADGQSPIEPGCIRLAPGDSADDLPWVRGARLRVQGGPRPTLLIESNEAVNHPIYLLGLRVGCGAEVKREFTLMPQAPLELPVAAAPAPVAARATSAPESAALPASETSPGGWTAIEGETLSGIASALFPNDPARQKSFIREAARSNPRLFRGVADPAQHPLPAGAELALPGSTSRKPERTAAARPKPAAIHPPMPAPSRRRAAEGNAPPDTAPKSAPAPLPRRGEDRLSVASGPGGEPGLKFSTLLDDARSRGLTEEQRERLRQEQRLIAELDDKIVASLALAEKIRNMEGYLDKLQGDMVRLDQKIQSAKGSGAADKAAPSAPATPSAAPAVVAKTPVARESDDGTNMPWLYLLLAGAAALVGWLWWRRRRTAEDDYAYPSAAAAADRAEPAEADDGPEQTISVPPPAPVAAAADSLALELDDHDDAEHRVGVAEHDSALELAEIMLSFGRVQGAAQTLSDYIKANPRQAIRPWLKLLEVYHGAGMRAEFEALVEQFRRNFNVQQIAWDDYTQDLARASLEDLPHLIGEVVASWGTAECLKLLQSHLQDNREGTRAGFPLGVVDDIATLIALLEPRLAPRPVMHAQAAA